MFQFIRKHQAIGLIFIGVVIVSFVIFFSPNQGGGAGGMPTGALGSINGRPIDRAEYLSAMKEARLTYMLRNQGQWPGRGGRDWDENREVLNRLFLLEEARGLGVVVADDVVVARIRELPFLNDERTGGFSLPAYDRFLAMLQTEGGLSRGDFEQFMRHEVALEHLVQVGGMSGSLVTPREAEARYRLGSDRYSGRLVYFSATNHLAEANLSPTNLLQFYSNRVAAYRIPERMQVRYVKFAMTNFFAEADQELASNTNLPAMVEAQYTQRGADSFRDAANNVKPADIAKEEIRGEFRKGFALNLGRIKANEFANRLYQMDPTADSLTQLATEMGMTAESSPPFTQGSIPIGLAVNSEFTRKAYGLSKDEPFATPSIGEDGIYVFAFERTIPSEVRPFQDVEASVIEAVRRTESRTAAEKAGSKFAEAATAALAEGKTFEAFATEAGYQSLAVTNFSNETRILDGLPSRLTVGELVRVAAELAPAKVGPFTPAADGGFVLYLDSRDPVADDTLKEALPEYLTQQRLYGRYGAFSDWERKRLATADVNLPGIGGTAATNTPAAN